MITVSENTQGLAIEDCKVLASFMDKSQAGRHMREKGDNYPPDAIAWWKDGNGRAWFAPLGAVAKWMLVLAFVATGAARADSLDIEWPDGKHEVYATGLVAGFDPGLTGTIQFQSFEPASWVIDHDTLFHDGFDAGRWTFNIGYPGGHWSDTFLCEIMAGPLDIRTSCRAEAP